MDTVTDGVLCPREITRITVLQGHEDDTLLTFFPNGFICHDGDRMSVDEKLASIKENGAIYKMNGPYGEKPRAIQQDSFKCETLNSNESFVVVEKGGNSVWWWGGEGATPEETAYAKTLGATIAPGAANNSGFAEGSETEEFWTALGGKTAYASIKEMGIAPGFEPRLFHISNSMGYTHMKEVNNF